MTKSIYPEVSILMLTHNAPEYVEISIRSLKGLTEGVEFELIVLDNASDKKTVNLVRKLKKTGFIDKLELLNYNSLFAQGNNIASKFASDKSKYFLLLNSDVEIKSRNWLKNLLDVHTKVGGGISSYGIVDDPLRVDGYCLLIDALLYRTYPLDEGHQWWWAITKQQAKLLNKGINVQGFRHHEQWIHHFGGKSGTDYTTAKGMDVTREEAYSWFNGKTIKVIDR